MTLTPAGRYVVSCLILAVLLVIIGVAGRVASGQWDAGKVVAVLVAGPLVALILAMAWRWEA